jgi:uncharacterized protein (TIGR03067 family)
MCNFLVTHWFAITILFGVKEQMIRNDLEKLEGSWSVKSLVVEGKERDCAGQVFVFQGTKARFHFPKKLSLEGDRLRFGGDGTVEFTIVLDPMKRPKTIDLIFQDGKIKVISRGIYSIDRDKLKLCKIDDTPGKKRPNEFSSEPFSMTSLFVLERTKKRRP